MYSHIGNLLLINKSFLITFSAFLFLFFFKDNFVTYYLVHIISIAKLLLFELYKSYTKILRFHYYYKCYISWLDKSIDQ